MSWLSIAIFVVLLGGIAFVAALWFAARSRNMHIWMRSYYSRPARPKVAGPVHVMFCFVDHFEPMWGRADVGHAAQRASIAGAATTARLAGRHRDADGRPPQHSFFYPEEEYAEEHLDKIAALCADGFGEIEIHLHHDNDTAANFCDGDARASARRCTTPRRAVARSAHAAN